MPTKTTKLNKLAIYRDLGYEPHPGQLSVHKSKASRRVLAAGVRGGKTLCAAMEGLAASLEPAERSVGWVCAPTYDLADRVFREIQFHALRSLRHRIVSMKDHDRQILLRNMGGGLSEIRAKSADNAVSLLGEGLSWVIVDEAARLKPHIWQQHLSQRLVDRNGWALLISTPRGRDWFWDAWRRGQPGGDPDFQSWNWPSRANPALDPKIIEAERARLPERVFLQEYEAQFLEGGGSVFRNVRELATGDFQEPVLGKRYVAGLDLAKLGDFSVLVIMSQDRRVVFVDRFNKLDWDLQVTRVRAATDRFNRAEVNVDSTGAGEPVLEALRKAGIRARPYRFSVSSKADLVNNMCLMLEKRQIVLPKFEVCPEMLSELESYEYSVTEAGTIRTNAPGGQHDDMVVALCLAAWLVRRDAPAPLIAKWY